MSSYTSGRSPSPSQLLDSLDPVVTSENITWSSVSNHPSFAHQRPQHSQERHMMQTQRHSPPTTAATTQHNYYHLQHPSQQSQTTPKSMQSIPGDTHSHLHFPSKSSHQSFLSPNNNFTSNGGNDENALSLNPNTIVNKSTELLQGEDHQKSTRCLVSGSGELLVKGSSTPATVSSIPEPQLKQQIKGQFKDKDYSYVKFLRREPPHEYSYPKLIDPTANSNITPSTMATHTPSMATTANTIVTSSGGGFKTDASPSVNFPESKCEMDDTKSQSSAVKDSPVSSSGSQSGVTGGNWNRHNNNGSRYKLKSHFPASVGVDAKNPVSTNDYSSYLVKTSESGGSLSQLGGIANDEKNSLVGSCCSGSGSSCSGDSKRSCSKKHNHHHTRCGKSTKNCKLCSTGKPHSHYPHQSSSQHQFISELDSKSGKSAMYSPGGAPRNSGVPGCLGRQGSIIGGAGGSPTNAMTLTCAHCRESFSADDNRLGDCTEAPSCVRKGIETVTCLNCAQALLYHCMSDSEGDYVHPCECSNADGHAVRRWIGLSLLSVLVPCLCCYVPLISCYRCGELCNACGGRHEAS